MKLTRDPKTGKILDNGTPIMLRGGHHGLFTRDNNPARGLARPGSSTPFVVNYRGAPCVNNPQTCSPLPTDGNHHATLLTWPASNKWRGLFGYLKEKKCNLLRVWVTGGTAVYPPRPARPWDSTSPFDLFPFLPVARAVGGQKVWKWKVYQAVALGQWNDAYFERLATFADAADRAGVCLQVTLFNYFDMDNDPATSFKAWGQSPWNPALSDNPSTDPQWGANHLVNPPDASRPGPRYAFFFKPTNNLTTVQWALLNKVVQTLKGRGNIILEVMNEPRGASFADISRFNANVIDRIRDAAGNWTPLISVNASRPQGSPDEFDTDRWRQQHSQPGTPEFIPNYDRVDIISYHGMTGFDPYGGVKACGKTLSVPRVDPVSMQERIDEHAAAQQRRTEKKALMFSTDAARIDALEHFYCDVNHVGEKLDMHVRDGQIDTHLDHESRESREQLALKSDLRNWAYWCFKRGIGPNLGGLHFQNHSGGQRTFDQLLRAWQEATGTTPPDNPPDDDDDGPIGPGDGPGGGPGDGPKGPKGPRRER